MLKADFIYKSYHQDKVLDNISLEIAKGETLCILGKSGCGKTTLLKILSGLETLEKGNIFVNNKSVNLIPPHLRNIVYLSQETLLFPHLSVFENIAFGLKVRKVNNLEIVNSVNEMLMKLDLSEHSSKMPHQLSGGQQQRVSFGRALIINPSVLLLDEPFGKLDSDTRKQMQEFYRIISQKFSITSLFVTHDLKEAMTMGDKIGFMKNGHLKIYPSVKDFMEDSETGASKERDFWTNLID